MRTALWMHCYDTAIWFFEATWFVGLPFSGRRKLVCPSDLISQMLRGGERAQHPVGLHTHLQSCVLKLSCGLTPCLPVPFSALGDQVLPTKENPLNSFVSAPGLPTLGLEGDLDAHVWAFSIPYTCYLWRVQDSTGLSGTWAWQKGCMNSQRVVPMVQMNKLRHRYDTGGSGGGGRGCEPRDTGNLSKVEKARNGFSPGASRKDTALPAPWLQPSVTDVEHWTYRTTQQ